MKIDLDNFQAAFRSLPDPAGEAEVCADLRQELLIYVRGGCQTGGESFSRTTYYLRASGQKTGTVLSEQQDADPRQLIERAVEGSQYSQAEGREPLNQGDPCRIVTGGTAAGADELLAAGLRLEKVALEQKGCGAAAQCSIRRTLSARRVTNSRGLDRYLEHTGYLASLSVRADRGGMPGPQGRAETCVASLAELDCTALAKLALQRAEAVDGGGALPAVPVPTGRYAAVLSAEVTRNIMVTAWMAFTGSRMQSGASPFRLDGEAAASPLLSIVDDPVPPGWSVNYSLDSEGTLCRRKHILRAGRLETPLHTLSSAAAAGAAPTGNAGRVAGLSGTTPIGLITVPSCVYVEPGESTLEQMLEQMGDGLYLTYSLDVFHSINLASGEFSIPCGGIVYRSGRPVGAARELTIAGNLRDLLRNVCAVGDDLTLEEFMFYHNYSYGGPSLLVRDLAVASRQE